MNERTIGKLKGTCLVAVEAKSMTECVSKGGTQCALKGECERECGWFFQPAVFLEEDEEEQQ